jgi:hypothetical protein
MPLRIQAAGAISAQALRDALVENLEDIVEDYRLLEAALPYPGAPLLLDAGERPLLLSYDAEDGARALFQGLAAVQSLRADADWLARLHPAIPATHWNEPPSLAVIAPALPAGAELINLGMGLTLFTFRALRVNGEIGILLEAVGDTRLKPPAREPAVAPRTGAATAGAAKLGLSAEESAFFADLLEN